MQIYEIISAPQKESKVIQNTVGNIFSGQVVGKTAKTLSERFGKVLQKRQSMTINRNDTSTSISTQLDSLIPASKIANLTQGPEDIPRTDSRRQRQSSRRDQSLPENP